ncbi:WbqC family protein [Tamlana sp. 2_MG-2023]|nr:WbqC family protein [Tamlana sp. 2_MG-2023]MDO6758739.1 WbqC family protein [Tamlana sp. 2_MG-2023]MDO6789438.1 WbqC family protein [Tamlana sp. 1_MG-2023]
MQPYFFPYIGYFQLINTVDKFVFYDDVNFIKGGFVNRNSILLGNKSLRINVMLKKASSFKKINEITINNQINWQKKLLKQISQSYSKAPQFDVIYNLIEKIILNKEECLSGFLKQGIVQVCNYLDIETEIINSSKIYENKELKGKERIFDICKQERSSHYFNAIGGIALYDKQEFLNESIKLDFLKTGEIKYAQFANTFVPNLSIIDVLMFNSKVDVQKMLLNYKLS